MYKILLRIIIVFILIYSLIASNNVTAIQPEIDQVPNTDHEVEYYFNATSTSGSLYHYSVWISNTTLNVGSSLSVRARITLDEFAPVFGIHDFHDIVLIFLLDDNESFRLQKPGSDEQIQTGVISGPGGYFENSETFFIYQDYPSQLELFLVTSFREDISFASDPVTQDSISIANITVHDPSTVSGSLASTSDFTGSNSLSLFLLFSIVVDKMKRKSKIS